MPNPNTEPVTVAGAITTIVEAGLLLAISRGWIDITGDEVALILTIVVAALGVIGPALWARNMSTALADPRDKDNTPLVRKDGAEPLMVQQSRQLNHRRT